MEIFTTGAYCAPIQRIDGKWVWQVTCFEDDSFECDSGEGKYVSPVETASSEDGLMKTEDDDEVEDNPLEGYANGVIESKDLW